jgi:hypothetical protein
MAKKRRRRTGRADVASRIISVDEATPYVKILVYGRNGKGKTRFAATAPNVLIIDINEKGTRSTKGTGAHVFQVKTWDDVSALYWFLKAGDHDFDSVAIDTLTTMADLCMSRVLKEAADRDPTKDRKTPSMRDWGKVSQIMGPLMLAFRNLPMHVIFLAQERATGDPEEGEPIMHTVDLSRKVRGMALGCVEIIGRIYRKEVKTRNKKTKRVTSRWETRMLVGDHEEYDTKDRTFALGRIVRDPDMKAIISKASIEEE